MKENRIKIMIFFLVCGIFFSALTLILTYNSYNQYKVSVNNYVYGIVNVLQMKYPDIKEKEIIEILNNKKKQQYNDILKKYGVLEHNAALFEMEKDYHRHLITTFCFTLFIVFNFFVSFSLFYQKKEKTIQEITNYMKEINHKNYVLKISDNKEGKLSILRNEVYKTTLMLREESENLKKEKIALKDSISDISHQLKTPLTSILIMLDNIIDNPKMDEKTKTDFIKNVEHQVETIHFLIVSLLKISRFDADVVEFKKENIVVEKLIKNSIENITILNKEQKVNIEVVGDKKSSFVGDYHWELEAITNILKNAIEHSMENGNIKISVFDNPLFTKVRIQDDGIGMSKKDLQNIFKRFYKGENSKNDSIGIGLSLAKKIIEKDNGLIKVNSKKEMGTTFEIRYMK